MSKIFVIGYAPPAFLSGMKINAENYRTWQFLSPLIDDGHEICLCFYDPNWNLNRNSIPTDWAESLTCEFIPFNKIGWNKMLQQVHNKFNPDCIVSVNFHPSLYGTKIHTSKPIWMDIYGDYLTIVQAACYRAKSTRGVPTSIDFVKKVLNKGDIFSVCSKNQEHMLVGELAMAGRLNHRTFGYQFVRLIPPGVPAQKKETPSAEKHLLRSRLGLNNGDIVVLWCGGYNTWTDIDTLFRGLEWAMEMCINIKFLSVGANTYEDPNNVYSQFKKRIAQSRYKERFLLLGWLPWEEISDYYTISDIGLNIDSMHYETIYGTRTRLLEMIDFGLPVITSFGSEISNLLSEQKVAMTFDIGDWKGLGEKIIRLAQDQEYRREIGESAQRYAIEFLSFETTTSPLLEWVQKPTHAPDIGENGLLKNFHDLEFRTRSIARNLIWNITGLDR